MYNRYIPQPDGSYKRNLIQSRDAPQKTNQSFSSHEQTKSHKEKEDVCFKTNTHTSAAKEHQKAHNHYTSQSTKSLSYFFKNILPADLDTGDLLIIILLLLMAADSDESQNNALLTLLLYIFMDR